MKTIFFTNKRVTLFLTLSVLISTITFCQTVIHSSDFESGLDGWIDGGIYAARINSATWSYSGNYSLRLIGAHGVDSSFESPSFNLNSYDKVDFKFIFSADRMEHYGTFLIEYSSDNGVTWSTVSSYVSGSVLNKTADFENTSTTYYYCKISTLLKADYTFPNSNNSKFRIRNNANDTNSVGDIIYIDKISITGTTYSNLTVGPGGVITDLDLWLRADKLDGTSTVTDGVSVDKWVDNGKGNHAETMKTGQGPVYRNNSTYNINFNPVVEFQNDNNTSSSDMTYLKNRHELKGTAGFNSNDIFIVLIPDPNITNTMIPLDTFTSSDPTENTSYSEDVTGFGYGAYTQRFFSEYFAYCIGTTANLSGGPTGYGSADLSGSTNFNQMSIINSRHNSANNGVELFLNGNLISNVENAPSEFSEIKNTRYWLGRSQYWDGSFDGRIAEVITYSKRQNDGSSKTERNKIQSYLAIKYGITLGTNGISQDYVNSNKVLIWNASVNSGFNYDIAGIGRDDASLLNQKQSKSQNEMSDGTGPTSGILTMGLTDIYDTNNHNINDNANTIGDRNFLVWGNNGIDLNLPSTTIIVNMSSGITPSLTTNVNFTAMQRTWKVVETGGDVGKVKVSIPQNAVRNVSPPGDYLMFISDSPIFDPTADYRIMSTNGSNLETEYDFDGTKYITFGYSSEVVVERSIYFDGVADYIDMEDALNLNPSSFTISSWIKRGSGSNNTSILSKRDAAYTEGYDFKINGTGRLVMNWKNGSVQSIVSDVAIPLNKWYHVAVIYNGTTANLYIDGVLAKSKALSAPVNTNQSFYIAAAGKNTPTAYFEGNIDEVRIWNTNLTVDQLRYVMNQELENNLGFVNGKVIPQTIKNDIATIPWSQLAGYYPMSVYTYTNTNDASGNGNQGALRNLNTVDYQTAPLPYNSKSDGSWNTSSTWTNGGDLTLPNALSVVDNSTPIDWNIVETNHNVNIDTYTNLGRERSVLGLFVNTNELQINGDNNTNTGNGLTVTHHLKLDGVIDLEGESQLIQTQDSQFVVTSSGTLERDQQGTSDTYTYNYWSSPVGVSNTTSNNNDYTIPDVMKDGTQDINFLGSGFDGANTSPISIADYWMWKFVNNGGGYSAWQHVRSTGTMKSGEGYTMKGPGTGSISDPQNYVFVGKPNNGDIYLNINAGNDYLIGNPYPSAIDAHQFILDNGPTISGSGISTGTLYFWEHWGGGSHILQEYQGGYATYNLSGGVPSASLGSTHPDVGSGGVPTKTPGRYIPVGQGFFVVGEATGTIVFNNSHRTFQKEGNSNSVFTRGVNDETESTEANPDTRLKIRVAMNSVNTIRRQLLLTEDEIASEDVDLAYDGKLNESQIDDFYWLISDEKYSIQGINTIEENTVIPLGFHTNTDGNNSIVLDSVINGYEDLNIYIHDKSLDIYHDLSTGDYEFYAEAGAYLDRFELTFSAEVALSTNNDSEINGLDVHYNNSNESITIINSLNREIKSLEFYNILGQSIYNNTNIHSDSFLEFTVNNLSAGAYIVKLNTNTNSISKKVLVK